ncbi:MAG: hypothetical protein R3B06_02645 [Kofleriaceae bacterium]
MATAMASCQFKRPGDIDPPVDAAVVDAVADAVWQCTPGQDVCAGDVLTTCDADGQATVTTCAFGCAATNDRCYDLDPSNGLAAALDAARDAQPLALSGQAVIDTSTETVVDGNGLAVTVAARIISGGPVEIFAISVKSLDVFDVRVQGSRALAILSDGDVTIGGTLSVSAEHAYPGPGSISSGPCVGGSGAAMGSAYSGGGGGGFGSVGGRGGWAGAAPAGARGVIAGDATLVPLRGGCRGGTRLASDDPAPSLLAAPGGGGGALQLSARGRLTISPSAFIAANGGGAKGNTQPITPSCFTNGLCDAGAGGGAGGAILLEGAGLVVASTGGIVANGGAGKFGGIGLAADGMLAESPALAASTNPQAGAGGALGVDATDGGAGAATGWTEGAGGGGGVGRIRINLPPGATFDQGPPIISPAATIGSVGVR